MSLAIFLGQRITTPKINKGKNIDVMAKISSALPVPKIFWPVKKDATIKNIPTTISVGLLTLFLKPNI